MPTIHEAGVEGLLQPDSAGLLRVVGLVRCMLRQERAQYLLDIGEFLVRAEARELGVRQQQFGDWIVHPPIKPARGAGGSRTAGRST